MPIAAKFSGRDKKKRAGRRRATFFHKPDLPPAKSAGRGASFSAILFLFKNVFLKKLEKSNLIGLHFFFSMLYSEKVIFTL